MKKSILLVALSAFTLVASAQNLLQGSKLTDNWSVGVNAGGITPLTHSVFFKNMRPTVGVELNKQLTPIFGFGLEGMWSVNTSSSLTAFDHSNVSLLGKVNLNNLFAGYKGTPRLFEIEAVGGVGWLHSYVVGAGDTNDLSSKVGLNFNFNLGEEKAWTIAVKPALVYNLEGNANTGCRYNANNAAVELTAGLIYHFKGSNGKHHMTLARPYSQAELDGLNGKINDLRTQAQRDAKNAQNSLDAANNKINQLETELNNCRNQKPATVTTTTQALESVITFRQGKSTIDVSQLPNVERIATYMKNNPSSKVVIKGYASPEGGAEINAKIAQLRADVVKNSLVSKYKISSDRIAAKGMGVGDVFSEPDWNRVSICTLEETK